MIVDKKPGFPCRVSLTDADLGETVLLVPFHHHEVSSRLLSDESVSYLHIHNARPGCYNCRVLRA